MGSAVGRVAEVVMAGVLVTFTVGSVGADKGKSGKATAV